ncbi:uncharacterized protein BRD3OS isoform X1 [Pteropus medius]|uniref:putative uncharacterized protein BRD3OS isoform X1 n=1 Tax=Pteropus vampyrus TaxID=132908 RepID=UPI00196BB2C6|nr:putative uncharacterized protein BRD3OS isoform X1 [Pteropus giganteus]
MPAALPWRRGLRPRRPARLVPTAQESEARLGDWEPPDAWSREKVLVAGITLGKSRRLARQRALSERWLHTPKCHATLSPHELARAPIGEGGHGCRRRLPSRRTAPFQPGRRARLLKLSRPSHSVAIAGDT